MVLFGVFAGPSQVVAASPYVAGPPVAAYAGVVTLAAIRRRRSNAQVPHGPPATPFLLQAAAAAPWISSLVLVAAVDPVMAVPAAAFAVGFVRARRAATLSLLATVAVPVGFALWFAIAFSSEYYLARVDETLFGTALAALTAGAFLSPVFAVASLVWQRVADGGHERPAPSAPAGQG